MRDKYHVSPMANDFFVAYTVEMLHPNSPNQFH